MSEAKVRISISSGLSKEAVDKFKDAWAKITGSSKKSWKTPIIPIIVLDSMGEDSVANRLPDIDEDDSAPDPNESPFVKALRNIK